jgi:hypothetical protein
MLLHQGCDNLAKLIEVAWKGIKTEGELHGITMKSLWQEPMETRRKPAELQRHVGSINKQLHLLQFICCLTSSWSSARIDWILAFSPSQAYFESIIELNSSLDLNTKSIFASSADICEDYAIWKSRKKLKWIINGSFSFNWSHFRYGNKLITTKHKCLGTVRRRELWQIWISQRLFRCFDWKVEKILKWETFLTEVFVLFSVRDFRSESN